MGQPLSAAEDNCSASEPAMEVRLKRLSVIGTRFWLLAAFGVAGVDAPAPGQPAPAQQGATAPNATGNIINLRCRFGGSGARPEFFRIDIAEATVERWPAHISNHEIYWLEYRPTGIRLANVNRYDLSARLWTLPLNFAPNLTQQVAAQMPTLATPRMRSNFVFTLASAVAQAFNAMQTQAGVNPDPITGACERVSQAI